MIPIMDSKRQYAKIGDKMEAAVIEVMRSGSYILGKNNKALEEEFAAYCGTKYAVALNSGTDALHVALRALDIGAGDEVITTAFTFVATTEAIGIVGAKPVFADIDKDTFNIDPEKIEELITPKTKAIIPVHLYGQPCEMDKIMDIAKRHNLHVIEDACQGIGSEYKGQKAGSFGTFGCFSFYPTKNLGTMGDGGMLIMNDEKLRDRVVALRNHGGAVRYYHDEIGVNSRLDEIQAAILRVKLPYVDEWNAARKENAEYYNKLFSECTEIETPVELHDTKCIYHQYTVKVPNRDKVFDKMRENGIGVMLYYPVPLHMQKVHKYLNIPEMSLPNTVEDTKVVMSLPMFPEITKEEQETVAKTLIAIVKGEI